jgi:hypothetical protein
MRDVLEVVLQGEHGCPRGGHSWGVSTVDVPKGGGGDADRNSDADIGGCVVGVDVQDVSCAGGGS